MKWAKGKEVCFLTVLSVLYIICFPVNPLILTGVIEVDSYLASSIAGWVFWAIGMVLVMAPIIQFPRRGGVPRGKSFVHTTKLVSTGIYAVIRHPQYTGGIFAIFIATFLLYPHWLFVVLGVIGTLLTCLSTKYEDKRLVQKFGDDYVAYMQRVPGMNIILGLIRLWRKTNPLH